ncbi:hypothetical protein BU14_0180s0007 [Porphyra umbilicalis]|uniref:Uncharacterized protein n=1 Tax=Porphyra umbilicalis TaxID=2786 RepID=A0A1X6P7D4_PORUM|nr:hypothetical protein BU14_0180s0007 [Porphyra umbilicalis]|eukprot:OSX76660.1 hypothetical protein BU14_0180s0007 [Porphyra umbilicalis]
MVDAATVMAVGARAGIWSHAETAGVLPAAATPITPRSAIRRMAMSITVSGPNSTPAVVPNDRLTTTLRAGAAALKAEAISRAAKMVENSPNSVSANTLMHRTDARLATPAVAPATVAATCVPWPSPSTPEVMPPVQRSATYVVARPPNSACVARHPVSITYTVTPAPWEGKQGVEKKPSRGSLRWSMRSSPQKPATPPVMICVCRTAAGAPSVPTSSGAPAAARGVTLTAPADGAGAANSTAATSALTSSTPGMAMMVVKSGAAAATEQVARARRRVGRRRRAGGPFPRPPRPTPWLTRPPRRRGGGGRRPQCRLGTGSGTVAPPFPPAPAAPRATGGGRRPPRRAPAGRPPPTNPARHGPTPRARPPGLCCTPTGAPAGGSGVVCRPPPAGAEVSDQGADGRPPPAMRRPRPPPPAPSPQPLVPFPQCHPAPPPWFPSHRPPPPRDGPHPQPTRAPGRSRRRHWRGRGGGGSARTASGAAGGCPP